MNYTLADLLNSEHSLKNSLTKFWEGYRKLHKVDPVDRRHPDTVMSTVIDPEAVDNIYIELNQVGNLGGLLLEHGFVVFDNGTCREDSRGTVCFITDDLIWNHELLRQHGFGGIQFAGIPFTLGSGTVLTTIQEFINHFYPGQRLLKNTNELVDYLNTPTK